MSFLSALVSTFVLLIMLATVVGAVVVVARWRSLERRIRAAAMRELSEESASVASLAAMIAIAAVLLLSAWSSFLIVPLFVMGLLAEAVLALWYWEMRAVPVSEALWDDPMVRPRPHLPGPLQPNAPRPHPLPVPAVPPMRPEPPTPSTPGTGPGGTTTPPPDESDLVHKSFTWDYVPEGAAPGEAAVLQKIEMDISKGRYEERKKEKRLPYREWARYAATDMPECRALAMNFYNLHVGQDWSTLQQAGNVLAFTQKCITYARDDVTTGKTEWPRYPIETIMDEVGDCEDDAILTAAIMKRLGFEVALLLYPRHCAVGIGGAETLRGAFVKDKGSHRRYYYAETTSSGWIIGQVPEDYRDVEPEILPIEILAEGK